MDEPTEGLAPVIVAQVEEMLVRLGEEGDMSVLVIEQNIGVATAISKNVAIMVNGRVNRIIDSARLAADRELQQRLLALASSASTPSRSGYRSHRCRRRGQGASRRARSGRLYISNPRCDALVQPAHGAHRGRRARSRRHADRRRRPAESGLARLYQAHQGRPLSSSPARSIPRVRSCASFAT
jgi:ABC-type dipeptide/oligopeptide/nickel transport system ATPase component